MKVIFVTGASRGFGRAIATEYIKNRKEKREPVHLVLMARTLSALESVRDELHSIIPDGDAERIHLRIECCEIDLASVGQTRRKLAVHLEDWISSKTSHVQLIHNAGSLGPMKRVHQLHSAETELIEATVHLNYTCFTLMTSMLLDQALGQPRVASFDIINISSLAALQPFDAWSMYGSLKAAREHFLRYLIEEQKYQQPRPLLRKVLNYAPGPLDTGMQATVRDEMPKDSPVRQTFTDMQQKRSLLTCEQSARMMWRVIERDEYETGAHVDYYDVAQEMAEQ